MRTRFVTSALVLAAACTQAAPEPLTDAPVPTFEALSSPTAAPEAPSVTPPAAPPPPPQVPATAPPTDAPLRTSSPGPSPTSTSPPAPASAPAPRGTIEDAGGDVRPGTPLQDPPTSVDLRGLTLTRRADGYEIRVTFAGPPAERREGERVTNVATFFDVDRDGELDYQVYATSTDAGWGSAYYDHVRGEASYADDDEVDVRVEGDELVLRFPLDHLGDAERLQWAAVTQWGTFAELHAGTEARDRAPDDGRGVVWPAG